MAKIQIVGNEGSYIDTIDTSKLDMTDLKTKAMVMRDICVLCEMADDVDKLVRSAVKPNKGKL